MAQIKTECSGDCRVDLIIDTVAGTVRTVGPGLSRAVPFVEDPDTDLIMWDCPNDGYADSFDVHYNAERGY